MNYELIALDVDGTLVNSDQTVPSETIDALEQAQDAGMKVCLATGRSLVETLPVWRQLRIKTPCQPMVLIGGALVAEPDTGRTLYQKTIEPGLAGEYAKALGGRGYSAMAIVDPWRHGLDYYLVKSDDADEVRTRWFSQMNVKVRYVSSLGTDGQTPEILRINAVAEPAAAEAMGLELAEQFAGRLNIHSIVAPNYGITVVEAFAPATSKWAAVTYIAQSLRVPAGRIVAVGDDVNDLSMIRSAGLGVAMPWAPASVKASAKAVAEPDLARFIRGLLS